MALILYLFINNKQYHPFFHPLFLFSLTLCQPVGRLYRYFGSAMVTRSHARSGLDSVLFLLTPPFIIIRHRASYNLATPLAMRPCQSLCGSVRFPPLFVIRLRPINHHHSVHSIVIVMQRTSL
eukprot:scaffold25347_cov86-Skeletonema_dohrnii-CCMP3373.AAC.3